jgi:hypothetical protein
MARFAVLSCYLRILPLFGLPMEVAHVPRLPARQPPIELLAMGQGLE